MTRSARSSARFHAASVAAIAAVCFGIYANVLDADWVLDDWDNIVHNPSDRWTELSFSQLARTVTGATDRRPVAHVSFGLNHYFGGLDVTGYHVVNLLVHAANGLLVYVLALQLFARARALRDQATAPLGPDVLRPAALFAALLFAAHPLQTQSVSYVVQRMNSLAVTFYLSALLLALRARTTPGGAARRVLYCLALCCGLLALGTKEIAFTLPAAYWLVGWCFEGDLRLAWLRRRAFPLGLYGLAAAVLLWLSLTSAGWAELDFGPGERLLTQARVVVFYLSLIACPLPSRLNLLHEIEVSRSLLDPVSTLLSVMLLAALAAFAIREAHRRRVLFFGVAWFLLQLLLESSLVPLRMIFEHRTYLPMVGVALLVSWGLFTLLRARRVAAVVVAAALVAALSTATRVRNETWSDSRLLWADVAAKSPGDWLARMQMGSVLARAGRYEEALAEIDEAIRIEPDSSRPRDLRGAVLLALKRPEEALASQLEAARLDPRDARARANAARVLEELGRFDEAAAQLEESIEILPDDGSVHQLGRVRERQGRTQTALSLYLRSAEMNPRNRAATADAGRLLASIGWATEAIEQLSAALATPGDPRADAELRRHLGNALWGAGRPAEAIAALERSVAAAPESIPVVNDLAWMLATCPDASLRAPERSVALLESLLHGLGSADAGLLDTLAAGYAAAGRFERATEVAGVALANARSAGEARLAAGIEERLARYARGRAYLDPVAGPGIDPPSDTREQR